VNSRSVPPHNWYVVGRLDEEHPSIAGRLVDE